MLLRWLAVFYLTASSVVGQGVGGAIQSIPYELVDPLATKKIDFERFDEWKSGATLYWENLNFDAASFGNSFKGQYVAGQITGTIVSSPLMLAENTDPLRPDEPETGSTPNSFTFANGITIATREPNPSFMQFSLLGLSVKGNNVLSRSNWRYSSLNSSGWLRSEVAGIDPVSVLFNEDQFAIGFRVIPLRLANQSSSSGQQTGIPRLRVKFFNRSGEMIAEAILTPSHDKYIAFARCGQTADIAGIQITNTTRTGLAYDDFIFGVPTPDTAAETPIENSNLLTYPIEETEPNPLKVDLCSYYTS